MSMRQLWFRCAEPCHYPSVSQQGKRSNFLRLGAALDEYLRWILGFKSGGVLSLDSSGNETAQLVSICTCSCCYVLCGLVIRNILLLQQGKIPGVWLSCTNCWQVVGKSQVPFFKVVSNIYDQVLLSLHTRKTLSKTPSCDCKQTILWELFRQRSLATVVLWREVRYAALPTQGKTISLIALRVVSINRYTHWHTKCFLLTKATFCHDVKGLCYVTEQHNLNTFPSS